MGFSKSSADGRRRELRLLRRGLILALFAAIGMHISSVPLVAKWAADLLGNRDSAEDPIEVILVDEEVPILQEEEVTPPPPDDIVTHDEPAAAATEDSPPPLRTTEAVILTAPTAESIDTVSTDPVIATQSGVEGGQGAQGNADVAGIVSGSGRPNGNPSAPVGLTNVQQRQPVKRQVVPEIARVRPPMARNISCNPCSPPDYPLSELREKIEGQPIINVTFDRQGRVINATIKRTSGNPAFDQVALQEAKKNWRFQDPYSLGGKVSVEVAFVIKGSTKFQAATAAGRREVIPLPVQAPMTPMSQVSTRVIPPNSPNSPPRSSPPQAASGGNTSDQDPPAPPFLEQTGAEESLTVEHEFTVEEGLTVEEDLTVDRLITDSPEIEEYRAIDNLETTPPRPQLNSKPILDNIQEQQSHHSDSTDFSPPPSPPILDPLPESSMD